MAKLWQKPVWLILTVLATALASFSAGVLATLKFLPRPSSNSGRIEKQASASKPADQTIIDGFHNIFYYRMPWNDSKWCGVKLLKYPTDLFVYQEMIQELKPTLILDIGTFEGGSAMYFATMLDLMGIRSGRVISVDIKQPAKLPQHPRITYLLGSSTSAAVLGRIKERIRPTDKIMVFLDSDHRMRHVLDELRAYSPIVSKGSYIVVEDTNVNGHPVWPDFGPGPWEAVHAFLKENAGFKIDKSREKYLLTVCPDGFLLKL